MARHSSTPLISGISQSEMTSRHPERRTTSSASLPSEAVSTSCPPCTNAWRSISRAIGSVSGPRRLLRVAGGQAVADHLEEGGRLLGELAEQASAKFAVSHATHQQSVEVERR